MVYNLSTDVCFRAEIRMDDDRKDDDKKSNMVDLMAFVRNRDFSYRGGRGGGNGMSNLKYYLFIALIIWLASGIFLVDDKGGEEAVVLRFGKVVRLVGAGLNYRLPYPIETHIKEKVYKARTFSVGMSNAESLRLLQNKSMARFKLGPQKSPMVRLFKTGGFRATKKGSNGASENFKAQAFMLTNDFNVINCSMSVMWSIKNLNDYLFKVRDPGGTLKLLAEAVLRAVIAQSAMDIALTKGKESIQNEVKENLQKVVNEYNLGILIRRIELQNVEEPLPVRSAFRGVENARQDREKTINQANAIAIEKTTVAKGEAKKITIAAQGYKEKVVEETKGEFQRYKNMIKGLRLSPKLQRKRLWLEAIESIYAGSSDKTLLPNSISGKGGNGVLPLLHLDPALNKNSSKASKSGGNSALLGKTSLNSDVK